MRVICVDDEELLLNLVVYMCEQLPPVTEVKGFTQAADALAYLEQENADIALLDIDMPEMNGIRLAVKIKELHPDTAIIFLTGYSHYAVEAFKIHAQGYLLKPINEERLAEEVTYALRGKAPSAMPHIFARTFGTFDFLVDGKPLHFSRLKAKELLAFLIDKRGAGVSRAEVFAAMYEDSLYDRKMQKQLDVIIRSLKNTLAENGVGEVFEMKAGELRIQPALIECDLYRLLDGDVQVINSYRGEYMDTYHWARLTEAFIDRNLAP